MKKKACLPVTFTPHHRVRLSAPGLTVGEHAHIVTIEGVLDHVLPEVLVDLSLGHEVCIPRVV